MLAASVVVWQLTQPALCCCACSGDSPRGMDADAGLRVYARWFMQEIENRGEGARNKARMPQAIPAWLLQLLRVVILRACIN